MQVSKLTSKGLRIQGPRFWGAVILRPVLLRCTVSACMLAPLAGGCLSQLAMDVMLSHPGLGT